jgi:hypothetical protein
MSKKELAGGQAMRQAGVVNMGVFEGQKIFCANQKAKGGVIYPSSNSNCSLLPTQTPSPK